MKFTMRYPQPEETDWEMIWGSVLGFVAVGGWAWIALRLPTPRCLIYRWTEWPCVTCGGTRAGRALMRGDFSEALAWNPLLTGSIVVAAMFVMYAGVVVGFRLPRLRVTAVTRRSGLLLRVSFVVVLAANWIYLIFRFSENL